MGHLYVLPDTSLLDVPAKLRELADRIEQDGEAVSVIVTVGRPHGTVSVHGYGPRSTALEAAGWLSRAMTSLTEGSLEDGSDSPSAA